MQKVQEDLRWITFLKRPEGLRTSRVFSLAFFPVPFPRVRKGVTVTHDKAHYQ
jgi:hypothetical protein